MINLQQVQQRDSHSDILKHYCSQLHIIFTQFNKKPPILKKKWRVEATSIVYFRKFFNVNSLIDYDPRLVM
jgi:hypothetical protein